MISKKLLKRSSLSWYRNDVNQNKAGAFFVCRNFIIKFKSIGLKNCGNVHACSCNFPLLSFADFCVFLFNSLISIMSTGKEQTISDSQHLCIFSCTEYLLSLSLKTYYICSLGVNFPQSSC